MEHERFASSWLRFASEPCSSIPYHFPFVLFKCWYLEVMQFEKIVLSTDSFFRGVSYPNILFLHVWLDYCLNLVQTENVAHIFGNCYHSLLRNFYSLQNAVRQEKKTAETNSYVKYALQLTKPLKCLTIHTIKLICCVVILNWKKKHWRFLWILPLYILWTNTSLVDCVVITVNLWSFYLYTWIWCNSSRSYTMRVG